MAGLSTNIPAHIEAEDIHHISLDLTDRGTDCRTRIPKNAQNVDV